MNLYQEIQKSFPTLEKLFSEKEMDKFKKGGFTNLPLYHFGLGIWIRNNLLTKDKHLYKVFVSYGFSDQDDMSSFMTELFYLYCRGECQQRDRI